MSFSCMRRRLTGAFASILLASLLACSNDPPITEATADKLESAPPAQVMAGTTLTVDAEIWRDFMPVSPPDGRGLNAVITVKSQGSNFPASVTVTRVWLSKRPEVWSAPTLETMPSTGMDSYVVIARDGPKWGPGIDVDVIVEVLYNGQRYLIRKPSVPINRTD